MYSSFAPLPLLERKQHRRSSSSDDEALVNNVLLNVELYNKLLYLCSSCNTELGLKRGFDIYKQMENGNFSSNSRSLLRKGRHTIWGDMDSSPKDALCDFESKTYFSTNSKENNSINEDTKPEIETKQETKYERILALRIPFSMSEIDADVDNIK
ncbi:hypothetical protein L2E82_43150 [Cichorium intybus]|uniref:Uncharacterized protein n=1 Tax=Cichorium intybus TaxID=13427 RepID=A0ACB8ZP44_CICIN|nr:hypothetical protein L2E82_43150 [Cichorium intybus]